MPSHTDYEEPTIEEREQRDAKYLLDSSWRVCENAFDLLKYAKERGDTALFDSRLSHFMSAAANHSEHMKTLSRGRALLRRMPSQETVLLRRLVEAADNKRDDSGSADLDEVYDHELDQAVEDARDHLVAIDQAAGE